MSDSQELDARFGDTAARAPRAQHPGQATMVEQARAIAEVRAAVMIAMDRPRDRTGAIAEMREVCGIPALADRAFFRVERGGSFVNGETIHLARELARCWGNIDYGVKELARDDTNGQSEMLAFAWDLQTNARSEITFIIPHTRGSGKKKRLLTGTQEIYENNASFAGRRLREAIFAVLPVWFKSEAADICHRTLEQGGGKPLIQRIADLRVAFEGLGVTVEQIEKKRGRKIDNFLAEDVGALRIVYGSLKHGEVTVAEEFPPEEQDTPRPAIGKLDALEQAMTATTPHPIPPAGTNQPQTERKDALHDAASRNARQEAAHQPPAGGNTTTMPDLLGSAARPSRSYHVTLQDETSTGWDGWQKAIQAMIEAGDPPAHILRDNRENLGIFEQVNQYEHNRLMRVLNEAAL